MKARIYVSPKESILDPQGKAVMGALKNLGFNEILEVRIGKYIQIEIADGAEARSRVKEMCEQLLHNPLIESYRFEILE
jgi:phosphoribosylformylglycinamidine synthase